MLPVQMENQYKVASMPQTEEEGIEDTTEAVDVAAETTENQIMFVILHMSDIKSSLSDTMEG